MGMEMRGLRFAAVLTLVGCDPPPIDAPPEEVCSEPDGDLALEIADDLHAQPTFRVELLVAIAAAAPGGLDSERARAALTTATVIADAVDREPRHMTSETRWRSRSGTSSTDGSTTPRAWPGTPTGEHASRSW